MKCRKKPSYSGFATISTISKPTAQRRNFPQASRSSFYAVSCDVQFGQRLAAIGIAVAQYEQSLVFGAAAGAGLFQRFTIRMSRKIAKATIRKSMMLFRNTP